jgi:cytochrome c-type biogenesis protein CcmF
MPWLIATALLHSALATERTGAFRSWTLLLAIAGFSLSLIGTFLVRSGVLTSVHAFANDPARGFYMLVLIFVAVGGALALFAWRAPSLEEGASFAPVSRETALLLNNVFLTAATSAVFIGTLYPLALDSLTGTKLSVGPPFFAVTFAPFFLAMLILVPLGPRLGWKKGDAVGALRTLAPAAGIALVAALAILAFTTPRTLAGAGAFAVASWLVAASIIDIRRRGLQSLSSTASALAHAGLAVTLIGIAGTTLWRSEALEVLGPGESMDVGGYTLRLDAVEARQGPNYQAARADITVLYRGETLASMHPEKRLYPIEQQDTVETAIRTTIFNDLYLALGDERENGRWIVRAYVNPLAPLIWLGALVMALGGFAALWSRLRSTRAALGAVAAPAE